jgi:hypothetical protein
MLNVVITRPSGVSTKPDIAPTDPKKPGSLPPRYAAPRPPIEIPSSAW